MLFPIQTNQQLKPILKAFRKRAGLTQAGVASLLNVTQQSYAKIEANPDSTSVARLFSILRLLGCKVFLSEENLSLEDSKAAGQGAAAHQAAGPGNRLGKIKRAKVDNASLGSKRTAVTAPKKSAGQKTEKVIAPAKLIAPSAKKEIW